MERISSNTRSAIRALVPADSTLTIAARLRTRSLNLTIVSLIENMDSEGWTRMMLGPLAPCVNALNAWPADKRPVDAVLVIAEALQDADPRFVQLNEYVEKGGKMLVFGKPAASLRAMLPVEFDAADPWIETPQRLQTQPEGPWTDFDNLQVPPRYGVRVRAKPDARVLAYWEDGSPAVALGTFGQGQVVYVGSGSGQVWQQRAALEGADELALRLLYWLARGERGVAAMLDRAEQSHVQEVAECKAICDRVLEGLGLEPPPHSVVVSRQNTGRFGWLIEEGGLAENLRSDGTVSGPVTRAFSFGGTQPVVNVGAAQDTGSEASYGVEINGESNRRATAVQQNWLAKSVTWRYRNGDTVKSTLSLGSPGILWEGGAVRVKLTYSSATHLAFASPNGIRVIARGASIDPADLSEPWLLAFTAGDEVRDMPQLFVLTRRPERIEFAGGIRLDYGDGGFRALFASRLWGLRRLAPGQTIAWREQIPSSAISTVRQRCRAFLAFPVDCDEVAWVQDGMVTLVDRYRFDRIESEWGTQPLEVAPLPPVLSLANAVQAPVRLPEDHLDLEYATTSGPLEGVPGDTMVVRIPVPPQDHRALMAIQGRMVLQDDIDRRTAGLNLGQRRYSTARNEGAGYLHADLAPYDRSGTLPFNEAACIDPYKWWYTFNAILARPIYSELVREQVDRHFHMRYWETLNYYAHKCMVQQKREPWTGVEYIISFVWPTQTQAGWRNFNDANEAAGINAYCFANYARYYGDWVTLRANWNHCRRLHEFLPRVHDWATMASGALEYWRVAGLDMVNSEPYGNMAFAYAAANTGHLQDEAVGMVLGAKSLVTAVARFGFEDYLHAITADGDPWREFQGHYWFLEDGIQASRRRMGSIGMHDTSKGTHHELSLAYKVWIPASIQAHEEKLHAEGQNSPPDLTQRLFLGWDLHDLLERFRNGSARPPINWSATKDLYDLGLASSGDVPVFLSDWAPAEYVSGQFDPAIQALSLIFHNHERGSYAVRIYSQREPRDVSENGVPVAVSSERWSYDPKSGWLRILLEGTDEKHIRIQLGEPVAPLHPYFTKVSR